MLKPNLEYILGRKVRWPRRQKESTHSRKYMYGRVIYACPIAYTTGLTPVMLIDTTSNQPCHWWSYEEYERFIYAPRRNKFFRSSSPKLVIVKRMLIGEKEDTYPPMYYAPNLAGMIVTHMELDRVNRTGSPLIGHRPALPSLPSNVANYPNVQYTTEKPKKYGRVGSRIKK